MTKKLFCILISVLLAVSVLPVSAFAADDAYIPLDQSQPIAFDGSTVTWNGQTFVLDQNTIFLDYSPS